jgi:hypothetical protein
VRLRGESAEPAAQSQPSLAGELIDHIGIGVSDLAAARLAASG